MEIKFDYKSKVALNEQLVLAIQKKIIKGELSPGMKLPSVRRLSEELKICTTTVSCAYRKLSKEGLIYAVPCKGYAVNDNIKEIRDENIAKIKERISELYISLKDNGYSREDIVALLDDAWSGKA